LVSRNYILKRQWYRIEVLSCLQADEGLAPASDKHWLKKHKLQLIVAIVGIEHVFQSAGIFHHDGWSQCTVLVPVHTRLGEFSAGSCNQAEGNMGIIYCFTQHAVVIMIIQVESFLISRFYTLQRSVQPYGEILQRINSGKYIRLVYGA